MGTRRISRKFTSCAQALRRERLEQDVAEPVCHVEGRCDCKEKNNEY